MSQPTLMYGKPVAEQITAQIQRELPAFLVTSVGSASYRIDAEMLKPGVVVFDIATRVTPEGKLVGDVDFRSVVDKASKITPVPGGVGPVTVAALTENLFRAAKFCCGAEAPGYTFG